MNDTVTKILELADDFAAATHNYFADQANVVAWEKMVSARQALQDELVRLFTPLTDEQTTKFLRDECIYTSEDICGWSFGQGTKWAERQHGITGEKNEPDKYWHLRNIPGLTVDKDGNIGVGPK